MLSNSYTTVMKFSVQNFCCLSNAKIEVIFLSICLYIAYTQTIPDYTVRYLFLISKSHCCEGTYWVYHCEMQDLLMVFLYDRHFFLTLSTNLVNNCTMCNSPMLSKIILVINFSDHKFSVWANTFFFLKEKNTQYSYFYINFF